MAGETAVGTFDDVLTSADFEQMVGKHVASMRRLVAMGGVGADSEDVVQESLLRAWTRLSTFRPERGSLRVWLLAITADQVRRRRTRTPSWRLVSLEIGHDRVGPMDPVADMDLRDAIDALPRRQRQAVLLFYYLDLSIAETGVLMNCSPGTVKSTLSDARTNLAAKIGEPNA